MNKDLSKILWLLVPISVAILPYAARISSLDTDRFMYGELGLIENLTVIFLLVAIIVSILFLISGNNSNFAIFRAWMILFLIGCTYYAGEEISWGQHFFGWSTPDEWSSVNDQQETNLHNTSALFDQIPRTLLSVAALIGGVLMPVYRRFKHHVPNADSIYDWVWPTHVCLPAALLALLVSWHEKAYRSLGIEIPAVLNIRAGETKECLLALFMMMYALSIWYRNRNLKN